MSALNETIPVEFLRANSNGQRLFSVVAGVPAADALSGASCLLESAIAVLMQEEDGSASLFAAIRLVEMAKAAIDSARGEA